MPSPLKENVMDLVYLGIALVLWALVSGMAAGCARLGGTKS
jgi:hypothetical protein